LLEAMRGPMMSVTLTLPGDENPLADPDEMRERLGKQVDLVIDGGWGGYEPSTVIDLTGEVPVIARRGKGDPSVVEG